MNHLSEPRERVKISLGVAAALILTVVLTGTALATPVTFNLNYTLEGGSGAAVGTFTVDSSLLVPDVNTMDLADLLCFNLTVTVPGAPTQTFTKADLSYWFFVTDSSANIENVNFFMEECGSRDFYIWGYSMLMLAFYDCSGPPRPIALFGAHPEEGGSCTGLTGVPTLARTGLVALMLLVGVAAALALRRGATLG